MDGDGSNDMRILQLTDDTHEGRLGWSPDPRPRLIATRRTKGRATVLSRGLDRDRAVDESGNQIAVFNRVGSRRFTFEEMARFYRRKDGSVYTVPR